MEKLFNYIFFPLLHASSGYNEKTNLCERKRIMEYRENMKCLFEFFYTEAANIFWTLNLVHYKYICFHHYKICNGSLIINKRKNVEVTKQQREIRHNWDKWKSFYFPWSTWFDHLLVLRYHISVVEDWGFVQGITIGISWDRQHAYVIKWDMWRKSTDM